jgi:GH15 family glucan-1,4-alpha-glucosidase
VLDADPSFRPVNKRDGYLALEDMGLIGDGTASALVGLDGGVHWLCLPRFDSEPLFCGLLDHAKGGHFTVAPDEVIEARQRYEPDTAVLVTELRGPTGVLAVTDALALRPGTDLSDDAPAGRQELIRSAVVLDGSVRVRVEIDPRGDASAEAAAGGLSVEARGLDEASELYASLCARASTVGLLPEQIDPTTGEFYGNFPQAFSHIGVIAAGIRLERGH